MRRYLLDTHVVIWMIEGNTKRLGEFQDIILDKNNELFVSIASYWEIVIKSSIGKLRTIHDIPLAIEASDVQWLNIELEHLEYIRHLPHIHGDPLDRLLVSQAKMEGMVLLTRDPKVAQYYS